MKALIHNLLLSGSILYIPVIVCALAGWKRWRNGLYLAVTSLLLLSAVVRVCYNWPLVCLFQEPYLVAFFTAVIAICFYRCDEGTAIVIGILSMVISYVALLFPGDIYCHFQKPTQRSHISFPFFLPSQGRRISVLPPWHPTCSSQTGSVNVRKEDGRTERSQILSWWVLLPTR
jgi:hypothetical protein